MHLGQTFECWFQTMIVNSAQMHQKCVTELWQMQRSNQKAVNASRTDSKQNVHNIQKVSNASGPNYQQKS